MFRKIALMTATVGLALSLSACTGAAGSELPTVTSPQFGTVPEINFPRAKPPTTTVLKVLDQGDGKGETVKADDMIVVDFYGEIWGGALMPDSTITDAAGPKALSLSNPPIEGWKKLEGTKVGQRVLLVVPPQSAYGELGAESIGVKKDDTLAYVVDIRQAIHADAASKFHTTPVEATLPQGITVDVDGAGNYSVSALQAGSSPNQIETVTVAQGDGKPVAAGQSVVVKQVSAKWHEETTPEAWQGNDFVALPADNYNLVDLPLGSIVLVTTPAGSSTDSEAFLMQLVDTYDTSR